MAAAVLRRCGDAAGTAGAERRREGGVERAAGGQVGVEGERGVRCLTPALTLPLLFKAAQRVRCRWLGGRVG